MKGNGSRALIIKRQWNVLSQLWPALVKAQHSEELSILKVIDDVNSAVTKYFETPAIKIEVRDSVFVFFFSICSP